MENLVNLTEAKEMIAKHFKLPLSEKVPVKAVLDYFEQQGKIENDEQFLQVKVFPLPETLTFCYKEKYQNG